MSIFKWPFKRKTYDGINNPRYVSDVQAANEAVLDGIAAVTGLGGADFAIITGLDYTPGAPFGTYAAGIIYFNGSFYLVQNLFAENLYLAINNVDVLPVPFDDGNARNIYTEQYAVSTAVAAGSTPQFSGNMNQYRIGLKYFQAVIIALQAVATSLKGGAFADIGQAAGNVAAGNDNRLVYTAAQFTSLFAAKSPSGIGEIKYWYDFAGNFLANFDGTGNGITAPWIGWHLFNGQDGYPDATGSMMVGAGVNFASKSTGGSGQVTLIADNIPPLKTSPDFAGGPGSSVQAYAKSNSGSLSNMGVNNGSLTTPVNIQNKYIAVYVIARVA